MNNYFNQIQNRAQNQKGAYDFLIEPQNIHEVMAFDAEAFDKMVKEQDFRQTIPSSIKKSWKKLRIYLEGFANYAANIDDIRTLTLLANEMGAMTLVRVENYSGVLHIILNGNARLRSLLSGIKYRADNIKIVSMGLGVAGAIDAAKKGSILTVILVSAFRVIDYILRDTMTLSMLIGSLASDVAKVMIAYGATILFLKATGTVLTIAIGPIAAVIAVGIGAHLLFNYLEDNFHITEKLIIAINELIEDPSKMLSESIFDYKTNAINNNFGLSSL